MLDIPSISAVVAALGVLVGVALAILELRNITKTRQMDMLIRLYSLWGSEDLQKAGWHVSSLEYEDYDDFIKKYGDVTELTPRNLGIFRTGWFFNGIGILLRKKLADIELVDDLFGYMIIWLWEAMKPIVYGERKQFKQPRSLQWFEYLYNEMHKREQSLQQTQQ